MSGLMQELDDMARSADGLLPPIDAPRTWTLPEPARQHLAALYAAAAEAGQRFNDALGLARLTLGVAPEQLTGFNLDDGTFTAQTTEGLEALRRQVEGGA